MSAQGLHRPDWVEGGGFRSAGEMGQDKTVRAEMECGEQEMFLPWADPVPGHGPT